MKNVFVLGLDEFNREELASINRAESCRFHDLLSYGEIVDPESGAFDFANLLQKAERRLAAFPGYVDAIIAFWDFPSTAMAGVLRNAHGLPGPSNEAIARCEHKYWSRCEQRKVVPDLIPGFCAIDPFAEDPFATIDIDYPFWIKPVKAHSSRLGFKIREPKELRGHLDEIRDGIGFFAEPFNEYLRHVDVPDAIRPVTGHWCIAEEIISAGQQCTLEGYVHDGDVRVYGVVDSVRSGKHRSSLTRYQYPSMLPRLARERMIEAAAAVMRQFDFDNGTFNMEFYWDRQSGAIRLLEVNARISKSHCPLFRLVDGASHQEVMVDLMLGERPDFAQRRGRFPMAAKFMHRSFEDGEVRALPSREEIDRVQTDYPEARFRLVAEEGQRLGESPHRDSYSYELADIFLGGRNRQELLKKYERILEMVTFDIRPAEEEAA